jgi:adenine/guanine phosphoribosyltransferase-like PRPP-binding protein
MMISRFLNLHLQFNWVYTTLKVYKLILIDKSSGLNDVNVEDITSLTSFIVSGCEFGTVYNIFFETNSNKFCYQTIDYDDYLLSETFISNWLKPKIDYIVDKVNRETVAIGQYNISTKGISVGSMFFCWSESYTIPDGIKTTLKNKKEEYVIDNTKDFNGYLISYLLSPLVDDTLKRARLKWMGEEHFSGVKSKLKCESAIKKHLDLQNILYSYATKAIKNVNFNNMLNDEHNHDCALSLIDDFNSIHSITDYYPLRNKNHETHNIIKIKRKDKKICRHYANEIDRFILDYALEKHELLVAPSSTQGIPENGMSIIAEYLSYKYNVSWGLLERSFTVPPSHLSNDRSIEKHLDSIQVNETDLKGRKFLVIDDVTTTGNTLLAIQNLLYDHGAYNVMLLAIGKTKKNPSQ